MIKPKRITYVPLLEEHVAINNRFMSLPLKMQMDLSRIINIDEDAVICGQLGEYLTGMTSVMPDSINVIVKSVRKLTEGCQNSDMPCDDVNFKIQIIDDEEEERAQQHDPLICRDGYHGDEERAQHSHEVVDSDDAQKTANIVVIRIDPDGEITEMNELPQPIRGDYEEDGTFHIEESFIWVGNGPDGTKGQVCVFETCNRIKTMPIELGGITVLVEDPGVMAEYRAKFAKAKDKHDMKSHLKFDKSAGHDSDKKQGHVEHDNDLQNVPKK